MKLYFNLALLFGAAFLAPLAFSAPSTPSTSVVKAEHLNMGMLAAGRPSEIDLWFLQGQCTDASAKLFCLDDSVDTSKVVVISHGSMGAASEYSWIAQGLAAAGFVVMGVNHYGESWIYGQDSIDPRAPILIWQRAQDISAILDQLSSRHIFQNKVDWSTIIGLGHSAGGQTMAMLGGATFDLKQVVDYCASEASKGDLSCGYGRKNRQISDAFFKAFGAQQKDSRIKMLIMLDPALGVAANVQSLQKMTLPTLVVGATHNDFLPWNKHGLRYASEIKQAKTYLLTGQEGHFVFLSPCDNKIEVMGIPLCKDRSGVDRKVIQQKLVKVIKTFIRENSTMLDRENASTDYHPPFIAYVNSVLQPFNLFDIVRYTPYWVFALLAMLVTFGLLQTRRRQVRIQMALIIPVVMCVLSVAGIIQFVGWHIVALCLWLLGIIAVTVLVVCVFNRNIADYDLKTQKLTINGSWIPLLVILAIFFTRYALGIIKAMDPSLLHQDDVQLSVSLLLGACSGFFLGRGVTFWRAMKP